MMKALKGIKKHIGKEEVNTDNSNLKTEEFKKLKEAYALNLCTVSVSQIVEYQDLYIMEQEYDTILNNLNLEEMPKDEALLSILKQILDVITFFRIQDGDRKMIEKEFQHRQKNAIWSAVPNITGLVGSTPVSIIASLATQVGVGYMNYRKQKAENQLEREKEEWKLQRSAIEQLNALRRELFDAAWRMAEAHGYPEKYRLTERQIKRYNEVLMDTDPLRRYERLDYMKESFEAYPPFWYQLGHAANEAYEINKEILKDYREHAITSYDAFLEKTNHNLLREDQLRASCALEKLGILMDSKDKDEDISELSGLIQMAISSAGNAYDVLQVCAISYLSVGDKENAKKELRMLVNEGYNTVLNAQLLSKLYINEKNAEDDQSAEYRTLADRVGKQFLYPWEDDESKFLKNQKENLLEKYESVLSQIITKYTREYNQAMPYSLSIRDSERGDDYSDAPEMISRRKQEIEKAFKQNKDEYLSCVIKGVSDRLDVLNKLCDEMESLPNCCSFDFYVQLGNFLSKDEYKEPLQNPRSVKDVHTLVDNLCLTDVADSAFQSAAKHIADVIKNCSDMNKLSEWETGLHRYCDAHQMRLPEQIFDNDLPAISMRPISRDLRRLMGEDFQKNLEETQEKTKWRRKMVEKVKEYKPQLLSGDKKDIIFAVSGEPHFNGYFDKKENKKFSGEKAWAIAVLDDKTKANHDIVLLTHHLWNGDKKGLFGRKGKDWIRYNEVTCSSKGLCLNDKDISYKDTGLNCEAFSQMCNELYSIVTEYSKRENQDPSRDGKEGGLYSSVRDSLSGQSDDSSAQNSDSSAQIADNHPEEVVDVFQEQYGE